MATQEKTESYFKRIKYPYEVIELGTTGLKTCPIGFGSYRVSFGNQENKKALRESLLSGCNLIDTSANYADGLSERLIGKVLGDLKSENLLTRDEVIVVTKAGYIQGENLTLAFNREKEGKPFKETVKISEGCYHSISTDFLEDQLERSLKRMELESIDFYLLHNPEYFFKATNDPVKFYEKIKDAFIYLEEEVKKGRISYYGVSSNTFVEDEDEESFSSLQKMVEIAESISQNHHFALAQFPLNLYETGAVFRVNNNSQTLVEYARSKNLATLINRPFNSYHGNHMKRLTDFPYHPDLKSMGVLDEKFKTALEIEKKCPPEYIQSFEYIRFAEVLDQSFTDIQDIATWKEIRDYQIAPHLHNYEDQMSHFVNPKMRMWFSEYIIALESLLETLTHYFENKAHEQSQALQDMLFEQEPQLEKTSKFSQKLIQIYRSIDGVDVVLVGMRKPSYVKECMALKSKINSQKVKEVLAYFTH